MKKITALFFLALFSTNANAFQVESQKELGAGEAKNQNVIVKCTTLQGKVSGTMCHLRRFAKCKGAKCSGWQDWKDLRAPGKSYSDWRNAASECCAAKGLR